MYKRQLGKAASSLRGRLGESLATIQKFDVPVEATTPSLEALKAFSMGITIFRAKGNAEAVPFYKRALELDPNFAVAYASLGPVSYTHLDVYKRQQLGSKRCMGRTEFLT